MRKKIEKKDPGIHLIPFLLALTIGVLIWLIPTPGGVSQNAWQLFAVFVATIFGIVAKALPMGASCLVALGVLTLTNTLQIQETLSGFSNPVIWLIVFAFFVAKSFIKTGLGLRIAYLFVSYFGKKSLGLAYGLALTDFALAPAIPSNTARCGGIIFPIIKSLAITFGSSPEEQTERKIGAFLIQSAYHCNIITCCMFLTAMAANPMMAQIAREMGIDMSWGQWAIAASIPGLLSLILIPWVLFKMSPPEIRETPQARSIAQKHLDEMGKVKREEWITMTVFFLMLLLWVFGSKIGIDSTSTALIGVGILVVSGVLSWKEITGEAAAWDALFWFSTLVMMASFLNRLGFIEWISSNIQSRVEVFEWPLAFSFLILGYFYSHYLFASSTAHASSMFAAFAAVGIIAGVPPLIMVYSLAFCSNLSACVTHYGTGPGPILYGARYVDLPTWWKNGAVISLIHLVVWMGIGFLWWRVIGLW